VNKATRELSFAIRRNIPAAVLALPMGTPLAASGEDRPHTPLSRVAVTGAPSEIRSQASPKGQLPTLDPDLETIRSLPARGADPTTASGAGGTSLSLAVLGVVSNDRLSLGSCQTETVRILVDHSPDNLTGRWALGTANFFHLDSSRSV
jgi:hypothetical protein